MNKNPCFLFDKPSWQHGREGREIPATLALVTTAICAVPLSWVRQHAFPKQKGQWSLLIPVNYTFWVPCVLCLLFSPSHKLCVNIIAVAKMIFLKVPQIRAITSVLCLLNNPTAKLWCQDKSINKEIQGMNISFLQIDKRSSYETCWGIWVGK